MTSSLPLYSKCCLVITLFFSTITAVQSQVTITSDDFPQVGMLIVKDVDSTTAFSPGSGGANQVWDFSNLSPSYTDSTLYIMPAGLPGSQNFADCNIVEKDANASANYDGSYNYIYYQSTPVGWEVMGQEVKISFWGISFIYHFRYDPQPIMLPFPCSLNTSKFQEVVWTSNSASWYAGVQIDTSLVRSHMSVNQVADGSGTMITPNGSFEALRIHENIVLVDSVFHYAAGTGWTFFETSTSQFENYRWFAEGIGEVGSIQIDAKKGTNGFSYFKSQTIVGFDHNSIHNEVKLYPNPAKDLINIYSPEDIEKVEIFDAEGKFVLHSDLKTIPVGNLKPGIYHLNVNIPGTMVSKKFIKY